VIKNKFPHSIFCLSAGVVLLPGMLMAGSFEPGDFQKLVPAEKNLSEAWIKSLTARGEPTVYRGPELKYIGMPIGGICAGQLYLGGDGNFWLWDIFNELRATGDVEYKTPMVPTQVVDQGFAVRIVSGAKPEIRPLNAKGFPEVSFRGEYPIGTVAYAAQEFPLEVTMEAFSPFTPLNVDDSSLPATVMKFTVKNTSSTAIEAELGGWLENVVAYKSSQLFSVSRVNRARKTGEATMLECSSRSNSSADAQQDRPLIVFEDFEREDWGKWKAEGTAFGSDPAQGTTRPEQKVEGYKGKRVANSYSAQADNAKGKLTAEPFKIERRFINFLIGGGNHMRQDGQIEMGINLLVDGKVVRNATGKDSDSMLLASWDVSELEGKTAVLEILDDRYDGWGHVNIDQIEFADRSPLVTGTIDEQRDVGSLVLALLDTTATDRVNPQLHGVAAESCFNLTSDGQEVVSPANLTKATKPVGSVVRSFKLEPGASREITFVMSWHFPNLVFPFTFFAGQATDERIHTEKGRYYGTKFDSAASVVGFVAKNAPRLIGNTELWRDNWYDSTLPYWMLDRTLLNISTLATSTVQRFANGRFYGWEGVGSCPGTCTHVWHYEQAMGRLFPELDILLRERVDFNPQAGFDAKTGVIGTRGELDHWLSLDGQSGTILRTYRDHLVSTDTSFLKRNWPQIKLATEKIMTLDSDKDGILDMPQANTLDGTWYGKIPWITGLGLAAVEASEQMALLVGDSAFAETCKTFVEAGKSNFVKTFWNGEYFEQIHDPAQLEHVGSYNGCLIDQVMGQGWAFQVGLDRLLPEDKTKAALNAIWKYNFASDVGPFREQRPAGRWYAMPGEAGTLMCAWPRGDKLRVTKGFDFYFNECMNGFEHQVAGHMIWEGEPGSELVKQGLAIQRAVHDRYHASKRNPWNEIEAGNHYARSMASYGVFLAACGFAYNGPEGHIGFAPKLTPENFKAAFTSAEGWGSFSQKQTATAMTASLALKYGQLKLKELTLVPQAGTTPQKVIATLDGKPVAATVKTAAGRAAISFDQTLVVPMGQTLAVTLE
jgi:non-lysosomal glucosylceramidase